MEEYFEKGDVDVATLKRAIKTGTISGAFRPVLCGTAFKNKGVQPLLDAVLDYLPSPIDVPGISVAAEEGEEDGEHSNRRRIKADPKAPFAGPRVQDHQRQVRHADLRARLCRHAEERRHGAEHDEGRQASASAGCSRCTPTSVRKSRKSPPATSRPSSA